MEVTVVCFGAMREFLPDPSAGRARVEIPPGATVLSVIEALGAGSRAVHSVLVDGLRVDIDHPLEEDAEVTLMPPFAGGSI